MQHRLLHLHNGDQMLHLNISDAISWVLLPRKVAILRCNLA